MQSLSKDFKMCLTVPLLEKGNVSCYILMLVVVEAGDG
jgi:hypothetical protein